jgi:hypothetical protein
VVEVAQPVTKLVLAAVALDHLTERGAGAVILTQLTHLLPQAAAALVALVATM